MPLVERRFVAVGPGAGDDPPRVTEGLFFHAPLRDLQPVGDGADQPVDGRGDQHEALDPRGILLKVPNGDPGACRVRQHQFGTTPERLIEQGNVLGLSHPGGAPGLLRGGRFPHSPQVRQDQPVVLTEPGQITHVDGMAGRPTGQYDHRLGIGRADLVEPQLGPFSTSVKSHDATL